MVTATSFLLLQKSHLSTYIQMVSSVLGFPAINDGFSPPQLIFSPVPSNFLPFSSYFAPLSQVRKANPPLDGSVDRLNMNSLLFIANFTFSRYSKCSMPLG